MFTQSNSSTESDTIPFANENAGTIKQRTIRSTNGWSTVFLVYLFYKTIHIFICVILELIQPMIAEGSHSMHTNSSYSIHSSTASQFSLMPPR